MPTEVPKQTLRLALAVSLAFGMGQLFGWRMAFLAPLLTVSLMMAPKPPTLKSGCGLVLIIAGTFALALVVALPLLRYPIPTMLVLAVALFWTFYLGRRGASPFAVLMMLIALTLIPVLGLESVDLSVEIAGGLAQAGLMAVLFAWLAFSLIPATPVLNQPTGNTDKTPPDPTQDVRLAWVSTAVVTPMLFVFLILGLSSYVLILVFVTLLAIQPDLSVGIKGGMGLIAGNALGGVIAIVVYELTVVMPNILFLSLLIALVCLVLGRRIFAGGATGALCSTALTTVLLIVGMTVSPIGPEADAKFYSRIVQIIAVALYIVGAFTVVDILTRRRPSAHRSEHDVVM